jgi:D-amino peptidase
VELHVRAGNVRGERGVRSGAGPIACELQAQTTVLADLFCQWPTIARVDGVTLRFDAPSMEHVVRTLNCLSAMSFMLR